MTGSTPVRHVKDISNRSPTAPVLSLTMDSCPEVCLTTPKPDSHLPSKLGTSTMCRSYPKFDPISMCLAPIRPSQTGASNDIGEQMDYPVARYQICLSRDSPRQTKPRPLISLRLHNNDNRAYLNSCRKSAYLKGAATSLSHASYGHQQSWSVRVKKIKHFQHPASLAGRGSNSSARISKDRKGSTSVHLRPGKGCGSRLIAPGYSIQHKELHYVARRHFQQQGHCRRCGRQL